MITVIATDERGDSTTTIFEVNRPPFVTNAIADTTLPIGGSQNDRDLPQLFVDPEGDQLVFAVESSDDSVVIATLISDDILVFIPRDTGKATITLAAKETEREVETIIDFEIIVRTSPKPLISHDRIDMHDVSQTLIIAAQVSDDEGVINRPVLNFRAGGSQNFAAVLMDTSFVNNTTFDAFGRIPAFAVTSRGLEYFIQAQDNHDLSSRLPGTGVFPVLIKVGGDGVRKEKSQPIGNAQTGFRLFSVPFELDSKKPQAIFEDDLGEYNNTKWRLFDWIPASTRGSVTKVEFPNTDDMTPGKALWLIVRESGRFIDTGAGTTISTSEPFPVALHEGWNLVGNPFNFTTIFQIDTSTDNILFLYAFVNGIWRNITEPNTQELEPFEGFAVFTDTTDTLFINSDRFASLNKLAKETETEKEEALWFIRILAQCQQAKDQNSLAAVIQGSSQKWDRMDAPEPPTIGEYVSVYFPHPEWHKLSKNFSTDFRPEPLDVDEWDFEVQTNINDIVNLTFEGVASVPADYEVWLVDKALKTTSNLRQNNSYAIAGRSEHAKRLTLMVGKPDSLNEKLAIFQQVPSNFELAQNYPNPFNPSTTIKYGVPSPVRVNLKVYSLLGKEVVTLVNDEQRESGFHATIWDGRNAAGHVVASGVYFVRMRAGNFVKTRKMLLVE